MSEEEHKLYMDFLKEFPPDFYYKGYPMYLMGEDISYKYYPKSISMYVAEINIHINKYEIRYMSGHATVKKEWLSDIDWNEFRRLRSIHKDCNPAYFQVRELPDHIRQTVNQMYWLAFLENAFGYDDKK